MVGDQIVSRRVSGEEEVGFSLDSLPGVYEDTKGENDGR